MTCKAGELSPQGGTVLRLEIPRRMSVRRKAIEERLRGRVTAIEFADLWVLLFEAEEFEKVADLIKPRRRRILSPKQRELAINRLKAYCFRNRSESPQPSASAATP